MNKFKVRDIVQLRPLFQINKNVIGVIMSVENFKGSPACRVKWDWDTNSPDILYYALYFVDDLVIVSDEYHYNKDFKEKIKDRII